MHVIVPNMDVHLKKGKRYVMLERKEGGFDIFEEIRA